MLEQLMFQLGLSLSSMLGGYSQEEWTPLLIHEKMAGHRDAQSHALCKIGYLFEGLEFGTYKFTWNGR